MRLPVTPRASSSFCLLSPVIRQPALRASSVHRYFAVTALRAEVGPSGQQTRHQHAISNPTLANIEKRWTEMEPQEQAELWMALRDRMTVDWHDMTMQEKKASYYIAFGPHGPRELRDPREKWEVTKMTLGGILLGVAIFGVIRYFAPPPPRTMNKEWQEATNEYLKAQGSEAITGISMEGYKGKGMVQSPPRADIPGLKPEEDEEDE